MSLRNFIMGAGLVGMLAGGAGYWYFGDQQEEIEMHPHMRNLRRLYDTTQNVVRLESSYKHNENLSQPIEQIEAAIDAEILRLEALPEVKVDQEKLKALQKTCLGFFSLMVGSGLLAYVASQKKNYS